MTDNLAHHLRLMLVTDDDLLGRRDVVDVCCAAVRGGVTCVQLRLKRLPPRRLLATARLLQRALKVPLIINDRPDVAAVMGAWVHLGPDDVPISIARRVLPAGTVIGASVGTEEEASGASDADYWGIGPLSGSTTKTDAGRSLGIEGFHTIVSLSRGKPCVAIGRVQPSDIPAVLAAGGVGVAVVSGILGAAEVEAAAREYARVLGNQG
jgi:thiamine-phosphate pyrophosphorylase